MRKLASVQVVNTVEPIPGADAIEKIRVLGWWVVTRKGEFKPGDRVVYCEIDALLPERPAFEFLRKSCYRAAEVDESGAVIQPAGFRIKTAKLRGQFSQGICFDLSILSEGLSEGLPDGASIDEGTDVSERLGIVKFEPPVPTGMSGKVKGVFPGFVPKTDEIRVQVIPDVLERHRGKAFYLTEKEDGTSFTAFLHQGELGICGRNLWFDETDDTNALVRLARQLELDRKLGAIRGMIGRDVAVQGEVIGPGIQKNKYAQKAHRLRVFGVFDIQEHRLLDHARMLEVLAAVGLETVPQLGTLVLDHSVDQLVDLSMGTSVLNPNVQREGIVLRPLIDEQDPDIGRLSFKAINPKFLVKFDE